MATRAREHMEEIEEDEEIEEEMDTLLVCLDMLRGSSALLRQHKAGLAGLLPSRGWKARRALERLVADLTDVLSSIPSATAGSQQQSRSQQQQQGGTGGKDEAAGRGGGRVEASGVKRARGQQAAQARSAEGPPLPQQQHSAEYSSSSCVRADPLGLAEVVEHVMSFAEGREVLGRLSRVCRLWRRVSEGEGLCLRVVEQYMPSALLGGEESLHARLGGSARRCLQVHNASVTSGRLLPRTQKLLEHEIELLMEVWCKGTALRASCGAPNLPVLDDDKVYLWIPFGFGEASRDEPFTAESLGADDIHALFGNGSVEMRVLVMDKATGVVASLWHGPFMHEGPPPQLVDRNQFEYTSKPVPITSMTYGGPPLQAQLDIFVELCDDPVGEEDEEIVHLQPERQWRISGSPGLKIMGQPAVYGEKFIRKRLAEEAMAAKQQGW